MTEDKDYTLHDLKLSEDLGGIKAMLSEIVKKIDDFNCQQICALEKCQAARVETHRTMWAKLDGHGRDLAWIKGVGIGLQAIWAGFLAWMGLR